MDEIPGFFTEGPWAVKVPLSKPEVRRDSRRLFSTILLQVVANEQGRLYERKIDANDLKIGINMLIHDRSYAYFHTSASRNLLLSSCS